MPRQQTELLGGPLLFVNTPTERSLFERRQSQLRATRTEPWYAVWLRSHHERVAARQIAARGFHTFLPEVRTWSKRHGSQHVIRTPMFAGYVFVRDALDRRRYMDLLKVPGVVRVVESGSRRARVPDQDIETIEKIVQADIIVFPSLRQLRGDPVRVLAGPLAGVNGHFVWDQQSAGRLIVSVDLLGRSIEVDMDAANVESSAPTSMAAALML